MSAAKRKPTKKRRVPRPKATVHDDYIQLLGRLFSLSEEMADLFEAFDFARELMLPEESAKTADRAAKRRGGLTTTTALLDRIRPAAYARRRREKEARQTAH